MRSELEKAWDHQVNASASDVHRYPPSLQHELKTQSYTAGQWVGIGCLIIFSAVLYFVLALALTAIAVPVNKAKAQHVTPAPDNCRGFIDKSCCCTSNCCHDIRGNEIEKVGGKYRVVATGAVVERIEPSRDGKLILCDCNGGARAYCLYFPPST